MSFDVFEFFFVLVFSQIIHLSQLVQLLECESGFSQILYLRTAVILSRVLISSRATLIQFSENHINIYTDGGAAPTALVPAALPAVGGTPPGAGASAPGSPRLASSCPVSRSPCKPPGVTPILRRSCP